MQGKVVLITGANAGIGKWTAVELARLGATVLAVARNRERGEEALEDIRESAPGARIELLLADLSSLEQVADLATEVESQSERLDVLINNAGLISSERRESEDGYELNFAVNHLAPFLLTLLLEDRLRASAPARVVNVASQAHLRAEIDFDDLQSESGYDTMQAYSRSKLANILFTRELARRLEGSGVTANCLHPGVVRSDFGGDGDLRGLFALGWRLMQPFLLSSRKGAETSVYLASSPEVEGTNGEYFDRCAVSRSSSQSRDEASAARLWAASERLVAPWLPGSGAASQSLQNPGGS